uniref:Evasin n=1 Tax=Amblyomma americanum TaxID=6943 RepID=A0A0C9S4J0_AMBAM
MTYATSFAVVIFLCAYQALVGFAESEGSVSTETEVISYEDDCQDDNSTCFIQTLNTTGEPRPVGCILECENSTQRLPNGTECLGLPGLAAVKMQRNVSYTCSVGLCNGEGVCDRTGLWIGCWTNTPPPNSTNVTTKPPTTTTASPGTG